MLTTKDKEEALKVATKKQRKQAAEELKSEHEERAKQVTAASLANVCPPLPPYATPTTKFYTPQIWLQASQKSVFRNALLCNYACGLPCRRNMSWQKLSSALCILTGKVSCVVDQLLLGFTDYYKK